MILIRTRRGDAVSALEEQIRCGFCGKCGSDVGCTSGGDGIYFAVQGLSEEEKGFVIISSATEGGFPIKVGKRSASKLIESISEITELPFSESCVYFFDSSDWVRVIENALVNSPSDERTELEDIASKTEPIPEGASR